MSEDEGATPPAPPPPPGWEDIFDPGERILWQGRPEAQFDWSALISLRAPMGLAMTGFALFWLIMTSGLTGNGPGFPANMVFLVFGLPFLAAGLSLLIGAPLTAWLRQRSSYYTLTDRNAFIATSFLGQRKLARYPLTSRLYPSLEEGLPGSVWFASRSPDFEAMARGRIEAFALSIARSGTRIGFEQIPEARRVARLMQEAVEAARAREASGEGAPR